VADDLTYDSSCMGLYKQFLSGEELNLLIKRMAIALHLHG